MIFLVFNEMVLGWYFLMKYYPYLIFCILMKGLEVEVSDNIPSASYFFCFNKILGWPFLITYHPYLIFCVLMKFQGGSSWWHAIRTLFFVFWWNVRVEVSDNIPSVPYFLWFNEILRRKFLMTYHPYLTFCVLMKF